MTQIILNFVKLNLNLIFDFVLINFYTILHFLTKINKSGFRDDLNMKKVKSDYFENKKDNQLNSNILTVLSNKYTD